MVFTGDHDDRICTGQASRIALANLFLVCDVIFDASTVRGCAFTNLIVLRDIICDASTVRMVDHVNPEPWQT